MKRAVSALAEKSNGTKLVTCGTDDKIYGKVADKLLKNEIETACDAKKKPIRITVNMDCEDKPVADSTSLY